MAGYAPPISMTGTNTTLFRLTAADMNSTADQVFEKVGNFTRYVVDRIVVADASIPITVAVGGVYTGPGKTGSVIVPAGQPYSGLSSATRVIFPVVATGGQDVMTAMTLYLSLTTPQGAPSTANWFMMGMCA